MTAGRLVIVSGASRGVGVGICRRVLEADSTAEVVVTARNIDAAERVRDELNASSASAAASPSCGGNGSGGDGGGGNQGRGRAHALRLDVTDPSSCEALSTALESCPEIFGPPDRPLSLVNNAGVAKDLPWFPSPWPPSAASDTLDVNLYGAERLTRALLPRLLGSEDGRVIFVSSGGGRANLSRMSESRREELLWEDLSWEDVRRIAGTFREEYEAAASEGMKAGNNSPQQQLPFLSSSGLWLQSYGFSKACLGAYCSIVARDHPSLLSVACSPGFIGTDMTKTYAKYDDLKSVDEGGEVEAWLATGDRNAMESGVFYQPDRTVVGWVAGEDVEADKRRKSRRLTTLQLQSDHIR